MAIAELNSVLQLSAVEKGGIYMTCKNCGYILSEGSRFCPVCGATADYGENVVNEMHCPVCGAKQEQGSMFCGECGASLGQTQILDDKTGFIKDDNPSVFGGVTPPKKNNNNVLLIIVLAAIIVISGTVIGSLLYINSNGDSVSPDDYNEIAGITSSTQSASGSSAAATNPPVVTNPPVSTPATIPYNSTNNTSVSGDYLFPSDSRYITQADLDSRTPAEIRLILNEMYAKHGYIFTSEQYQSYFSSKSWYRGRTTSQDEALAYFNSYERANRQTIIDYETAHGLR